MTRRPVLMWTALMIVAIAAEAQSTAPQMMLWVERNLGNHDSALQSELSVNGKSVGIYSSDTWEPIDRYLKGGWNTITIKTTP